MCSLLYFISGWRGWNVAIRILITFIQYLWLSSLRFNTKARILILLYDRFKIILLWTYFVLILDLGYYFISACHVWWPCTSTLAVMFSSLFLAIISQPCSAFYLSALRPTLPPHHLTVCLPSYFLPRVIPSFWYTGCNTRFCGYL